MILMTGATGNNGGEIAKQLVAAGIPIRVLVRDRSKATSFDSNVEVVEGDFARPDTLDRALEGVEKAFLLTPADPKQVELSSNFIQAAKRAGVKHIVKFSMFGADADSPFPLAQWHRQTEQEIESSGIAWTHLRPNDLMQNMRRFIESIKTEGTINLPVEEGKISMVDLRDVAAVAVKTLTEPGHEGQAYTLTGSEALSYTDIAQKLSSASDRSIRYVSPSMETFKQGLMQSGTPEAAADLMGAMYTLEQQNHNAEVTDTVSKITGKSCITFDEFAQEFAPKLSEPLAS